MLPQLVGTFHVSHSINKTCKFHFKKNVWFTELDLWFTEKMYGLLNFNLELKWALRTKCMVY